MLSISNKINDDVMIELLAVLSSDGENFANIVHGISIHMENGSFNRFSEICAINT